MTENDKSANLNSEAIRQIACELLLMVAESDILYEKLKPKEEPAILVLNNETELKFIVIDTVISIQANDYLSVFYLENNKKFEFSHHLTEVEPQLPPWFFKINRSTIINTRKMDTLYKKTRSLKLLKHDKIYIFSKEKLYQFRQYLKQNAYIIAGKKQ
jgi:DNA-binding LytR/AlgR family response regulator